MPNQNHPENQDLLYIFTAHLHTQIKNRTQKHKPKTELWMQHHEKANNRASNVAFPNRHVPIKFVSNERVPCSIESDPCQQSQPRT